MATRAAEALAAAQHDLHACLNNSSGGARIQKGCGWVWGVWRYGEARQGMCDLAEEDEPTGLMSADVVHAASAATATAVALALLYQ